DTPGQVKALSLAVSPCRLRCDRAASHDDQMRWVEALDASDVRAHALDPGRDLEPLGLVLEHLPVDGPGLSRRLEGATPRAEHDRRHADPDVFERGRRP